MVYTSITWYIDCSFRDINTYDGDHIVMFYKWSHLYSTFSLYLSTQLLPVYVRLEESEYAESVYKKFELVHFFGIVKKLITW